MLYLFIHLHSPFLSLYASLPFPVSCVRSLAVRGKYPGDVEIKLKKNAKNGALSVSVCACARAHVQVHDCPCTAVILVEGVPFQPEKTDDAQGASS